MSAREEILARIGRAVAGAADVEIPRHYRTTQQVDDLVTLFAERVDDYRAIVHVLPEAEVPGRIAESVAGRRMIVPDGFDREGGWTDLNTADGVITNCAVAVAETGTIVLDHGPGQGTRAQTLVPDYHLCVVRADQIVSCVPEAIARLDPSRPLTWISGPSATSDIELNRVEGVHGPRTLEVIVST
ncbi:LutC/YkgG family protein [Nonomuraea jiangxiensis]|uniref:L-lactate dehydrogenase complex protein LldG n=1 Tax=Nonomuraea jiangxiensis TaxID=633440 RepID=A0A1G9FWK1_9ACTN|nr:LUD domain-containing protein [Nonomuraea jiangxiensis]SDK92811.1 L-lactate dehydrogenase complex protein LldG [Nonomuraea jiangxiensis]